MTRYVLKNEKLRIYWLPNTYYSEEEFIVSVMLAPVKR